MGAALEAEGIEVTRYRVSEVYAAIQGEGELAGTPVVIVRLQGCHVGCPWCDTKHSWNPQGGPRGPVPAEATARELEQLAHAEGRVGKRIEWILLTGGEPAEQDLTQLVKHFSMEGWRVMLETSGTADGHLGVVDLIEHVTVSPKQGMPGGRPILPDVIRTASELKFVVGKRADVIAVESFLDHHHVPPSVRVSLQPVSQSVTATKLAVEECLKRGWFLSIQGHKFAGIP